MTIILPYNSQLKKRAQYLRKHATTAEVLLWQQLKGGQVLGTDFHRQKPIGNYIVDFFSPKLMLAIEIDGISHDGKYDYDKHREDFLKGKGISVLKFFDDDVKRDVNTIVSEIIKWIQQHCNTPLPLSRGELNTSISSHITSQKIPFQLLPALDIQDGTLVRASQSNKVHDPLTQAFLFQNQHAQYLHVVDLDGALHGNPKNFDLVKKIVENTTCKVEVSGGINSIKLIEKYLAINPWQIILGSMTVFNIPFIEDVVKKYGTKFTISLDSNNGYAASRGWVEKSEIRVGELAKRLEHIGIQRFIFTDVSRDGTLQGVNIEETVKLKRLIKGQIIASGGVASVEEIETLKKEGIDGVIIGKALYEGKILL